MTHERHTETADERPEACPGNDRRTPDPADDRPDAHHVFASHDEDTHAAEDSRTQRRPFDSPRRMTIEGVSTWRAAERSARVPARAVTGSPGGRDIHPFPPSLAGSGDVGSRTSRSALPRPTRADLRHVCPDSAWGRS